MLSAWRGPRVAIAPHVLPLPYDINMVNVPKRTIGSQINPHPEDPTENNPSTTEGATELTSVAVESVELPDDKPDDQPHDRPDDQSEELPPDWKPDEDSRSDSIEQDGAVPVLETGISDANENTAMRCTTVPTCQDTDRVVSQEPLQDGDPVVFICLFRFYKQSRVVIQLHIIFFSALKCLELHRLMIEDEKVSDGLNITQAIRFLE